MSKEVEFVDPEATLASADGGTNDLRLFELKVNRKLSWSARLRDLAWEVIYNRDLRGLARCAHMVVSFNAAGAFLHSRRDERDELCPRVLVAQARAH